MKLIIIIALAIGLLLLVRRRLIYVDLTFPWFVALVVLGLASIFEDFVATVAGILGIHFEPLSVVFIAIFILLAIITTLLISVTAIRRRQIDIVRTMAMSDLAAQERSQSIEGDGNT